jgi:hypothetical protein
MTTGVFTRTTRTTQCPQCGRIYEQRRRTNKPCRRCQNRNYYHASRGLPIPPANLEAGMPSRSLPEADPDCYRAGLLKIAAAIIMQTWSDITGAAQDITDDDRAEALDWWQSTAEDFGGSLVLTVELPSLNRVRYSDARGQIR